MIELQQLRNLDLEQVIDLLLEQKTQPFEIYIPKETQLYNSDREAISIDYCNLAYAGQLLFNASEEFSFEAVSPEKHESILFKIKYSNIELLAENLLLISYGYVNEDEEDEFRFDELVTEFFADLENDRIKLIACPYFVEISKKFSKSDTH